MRKQSRAGHVLSWGVALASLLTTAAATANINVDWDCQANPPIGSSQELTLGSTMDTTAPTDVTAGDIFEVVFAAHPLTVPATAAGYHLNNLRNVKLSVPVPAGATYQSASLSGGSNLGSGGATVSQANGVVTMSVPGPISGGATFQFPALHVSLGATGSPGSTVQTRVAGTSFSNPGLQFVANVHVSPGIEPDVPAKCYPKTSPVLSSTAIDAAGAAPVTRVGPALASSGNRTLAVATATDGRVMINFWDLGGAGVWREIPPASGFKSDTAPGACLVRSGSYAFVLARQAGTNNVWLNQGTPGGKWVGWQSVAQTTAVAPAAASSGDRSVSFITSPDGRVMYDWWDLGGGGHGYREVGPAGSLRTNAASGAALVSSGNYVFVLARSQTDGVVYLNQGNPTTGVWVGWQTTRIATNVAPAASAVGNRSIATVIMTDGRVMFDWWDLGGGGHGWTEIPGGFRTDQPAAVGFVDNGHYVFVEAKDLNGRLWINQGDPTTGKWVGWR